MHEDLKRRVCVANRRLETAGLVILTEGNVSEVTPDRKHCVIKPSGVEYRDLTPEKMVVVNMNGEAVEGKLLPSSDTPTHLEIYRRFPHVGGIAHTHSPFATIFAQTRKPIPCYGTTHADLCFGDIPVTRALTEAEIFGAYEMNTGNAIAELLAEHPHPCVLVASHGPFTFGASAKEAVDHAHALEKVAMMAALGEYKGPIHDALLKKHYFRKHGKDRYYGQRTSLV